VAAPPDFVLDERVHARREEVFRAWTEAERFARWFAPAPGARVEVASLGAAVGESIDLRVLREDGTALGLRGRVARAERPASPVTPVVTVPPAGFCTHHSLAAIQDAFARRLTFRSGLLTARS